MTTDVNSVSTAAKGALDQAGSAFRQFFLVLIRSGSKKASTTCNLQSRLDIVDVFSQAKAAAADYTSSEGWFLRGLLKNTPLTALLSGLKDAETLLQPQLSSLAEALG